MDTLTKSERSKLMSKVHGRGNKATELALVKIFRAHHITGWRRHRPIFGKPDFIFQKSKLAVFVDGCFWHGCPRHGTRPKGNAIFWRRKFSRNKSRDKLVNRTLRKAGWRVLRIWEHEFARSKANKIIQKIQRAHLSGLTRKS